MLLKIFKNRTVSSSGTWGTKNENNYEILNFEFPEELEEYNKRIVYYLGNQKVWDPIIDNKAILTNAITTKGSVKAYIWCTKSDEAFETDVDFRTQIFVMNFFENDNADGIVPTPEQVDGFNTMLTAMNEKIEEIDELETTIENAETQRQENEETRQNNESTRQENEQTRQSQEAERERKTDEAIGEIEDLTEAYNQNAEQKTEAFNNNATQKTDAFNQNAESKTNTFNTNATNKTNDFNSNASSKTNTFNENATSKTNTFNSNANDKTSAFNDNATQKTTNFDNNASSKTTTFNENATSKTNDFNDNAQAKTEAFDEHTAEMQQEIDELSANMPWNTTEQATEISVDDAAKYSKNKLELFGNTEQDNTKMTYKCDGTETGDYYLTYDSTDYYFTMPTITEGDILVFDTADLKLYLADTEITTESTGTGTNLTFIQSPNPDYPQDIHVVTGNNSVGVRGGNLFDKNNVTIYSGYFSASGVINGKGTNNSPDKWFYISCKPNTTYKIIKPVTPVLSNNRFRIGTTASIPNNNSTLDDFWMEPNGSTVTQHVITTSNNAKYLCVYYGSNPDAWNDKILAVLNGLEISYFSSYPINLGSIELCKIGHYQDYLYKDGDNWYKFGNVGKIIYDGTEGWSIRAFSDKNYLSLKRTLEVGENGGYCNNFISNNSYGAVMEHITLSKQWQECAFAILKSRLSTENATGFKNWLSEHNTTVYYILATPTTAQITDETLISQLDEIYEHLQLVKGTNNITVTAEDLAPYMKLSYMQDLPSKLNNLDSRLSLLE